MKQTSIKNYHDPRTKILIQSETEQILDVFKQYPDSELTAHEVAKLCLLNYFVIQKRMSILVKRNNIKEVRTVIVNLRPRTKYKLA